MEKSLPTGQRTNCEIELRDRALGWVGIPDYIGLFGPHCEIIDFKTGNPKQEHNFQLLVYAVLWARDKKQNPDGRLADKLTIAYRTGPVNVPAPTKNELTQLEQEITKRTEAARSAFNICPPEAKPNAENCTFCDVRHLCSTYWTEDTMRLLSHQNTSAGDFIDIDAKILSQQAMKSWKAVVVNSTLSPADTPVLLRTPVSDDLLDEALLSRVGDQVRVLGGRLITKPVDGSAVLLAMSDSSEAFLVRS